MRIICLLFLFAAAIADETYIYKTEYLQTPVDHFSFTNNETFQLRYLINDTFWRNGGPIFFYTGNEGDITMFAQNTGFMWELGQQLDAMVIFAEHRYYGKSMPFGDKSYAEPKYLGYLTSTQALADYVYLLDFIQKSYKKEPTRIPVIAFGGSYGGMLAAWLRQKYSYAVDGAVASSAPIYQFQGLTDCTAFNNIVSKVYKISSQNAVRNIKKSWSVIKNITGNDEGKLWLSKEWKLCKPLNSSQDITDLTEALEELYGNIAMINYNYPTNFLAPVPANPVQALCDRIDQSNLDGKDLLTALGKAISIYTNYTGAVKCLDFNSTAGSLGINGWDFQACTEMVMPMCTNLSNEMFEPSAWDFKKTVDDCYKKFGVRITRDDLAILAYGGKEAEYSNLIFTNGLLDPWSSGGVLKSNTRSVYAIIIPDGAHHLDLRSSNSKDRSSVISARENIRNIIQIWLKLYKQTYN